VNSRKKKNAAARSRCSKCGGAGSLPDRCRVCNAAFDPRLTPYAKTLPCGHSLDEWLEREKCDRCGGQVAEQLQYSIKDYRAAIRSLWLPIVARKKLNGAEMRFVQALWDAKEPIDLVLQAIRQVDQRRRQRNLAVYSLGIIRADLEALKIKRARMDVGGRSASRSKLSTEEWREEYGESLEELAEAVNHPERAAMYRELKRDLPKLSFEEATERFRGIK